jgi:serine/threonine-protein kinase
VSSAIQPGDLIAGKYRVDRVLGEGGMGVVVAATHEQLEQRVALKFLLPSFVGNAEIVQRFLREARAAVKIHSEHVARVLDVGVHEGTPFMVMECLEGDDLAQVLADRGPLPVAEAVGYVLQACEAIAEAHSAGVVHRDLKPANLFLARRPSGPPVIKVLDFGISKATSAAKDALVTQASAMMGSPAYMCPEQLVAAATVDARADIWSLGVVLYELVSKTVPYSGETMPELVASILTKPFAPLTKARPDVPAGFAALVERCLQKERDARFANVAELARALAPFGPPRSELSVERVEHVLGEAGRSEPRVAAAARALAANPESKTFLPTTSLVARPSGRRFIFLPLVGLAVGAAMVVFLVRPGRRAAGDAPVLPATVASSIGSSSAPPTQPSVRLADPTSVETTGTAAASSTPRTAPSPLPWATSRIAPRPGTSAHPQPSHTVAAAAPTCHVVTYFDADGNKHFKEECP